MRAELEQRLRQERAAAGGGLKSIRDLAARGVSNQDFLDCAVLGGVEIKDVIAGTVAEAAIPSSVLRAYHAQYPHLDPDFAASVRRLAHDPERLRGLVDGVRGKLFEENYVAWLNHGNLPAGYHAQLAQTANNPAWDIAVKDHAGHVDQLLQLKASASLRLAQQALAAHPRIDVVIPHDQFVDTHAHLAGRLIAGQLIDGHQTLQGLDSTMDHAVGHAEAGAAFHWPVLAIGVAALHSFSRYRQGVMSAGEALASAAERGSLAVAATLANWILLAAGTTTTVAIPASLLVRLAGGQISHNWRRRRRLERAVARGREAIQVLRQQVARGVLIEPCRRRR